MADNTRRRTKPLRIAILGPFGLGNLGDAATQDAAIAGIRSVVPDADIVGISLDPADTKLRHGIPAYPLRSGSQTGNLVAWLFRESAFLLRCAIRLAPIDVLIVSGGGQLDDTWGGASGQPYSLFVWCVLARLTFTRILFVSVGAGPILSPRSEWLLKRALKLAHYRSYRDPGSRDLIDSIGVTGGGSVVPDLAHDLEFGRQRTAASDRPTIGIGPMPHRHPDMSPRPGPDPELYDAYIRKLADFAEWLIAKKGFKVTFYVGEVHHDLLPISDLLDHLGRKCIVPDDVSLSNPPIASVSDLIDCLGTVDIVVASRFHGALIPLTMGVPCLALSYHPKVTDLMVAFEQADYVFDIDSASTEVMQERFDQLWKDRKAISEVLEATAREYRIAIRDQWKALFTERLG